MLLAGAVTQVTAMSNHDILINILCGAGVFLIETGKILAKYFLVGID